MGQRPHRLRVACQFAGLELCTVERHLSKVTLRKEPVNPAAATNPSCVDHAALGIFSEAPGQGLRDPALIMQLRGSRRMP
jgi:hypothetical protein